MIVLFNKFLKKKKTINFFNYLYLLVDALEEYGSGCIDNETIKIVNDDCHKRFARRWITLLFEPDSSVELNQLFRHDFNRLFAESTDFIFENVVIITVHVAHIQTVLQIFIPILKIIIIISKIN